jgi:hypothetical protein
MHARTKILGAVAAAALVAAGGAAFTGTGVTTTGQAASPQFVGGTVGQTVTGATVSHINYGFADPAHLYVTSVTVTFADALADGQNVSAVANGDDATATGVNGGFLDASVAVNHTVTLNWAAGTGSPTGYVGLNSIAITVDSTTP